VSYSAAQQDDEEDEHPLLEESEEESEEASEGEEGESLGDRVDAALGPGAQQARSHPTSCRWPRNFFFGCLRLRNLPLLPSRAKVGRRRGLLRKLALLCELASHRAARTAPAGAGTAVISGVLEEAAALGFFHPGLEVRQVYCQPSGFPTLLVFIVKSSASERVCRRGRQRALTEPAPAQALRHKAEALREGRRPEAVSGLTEDDI
jgi:hypothetical protein